MSVSKLVVHWEKTQASGMVGLWFDPFTLVKECTLWKKSYLLVYLLKSQTRVIESLDTKDDTEIPSLETNEIEQ